ncbi:zinc-ribbon domain-containing protein [Aquimarina algicola]|uniref:Zinc-ribbon domain-containing protein n=1 Tax=Aquimarina algicola TaxID=2589995 RepID=A0A504J8N1_9FLAO|nr:zinc-ribbon domain-containing protein [Aquimarina algicola]TPN87227.1 zinc-ribbon domain-containing protein [Aquimarina algicola]
MNGAECSFCKNRDTFMVTTFGKYFHLFWIPLFPVSRTSVAECQHCKRTFREREFTSEMLRALQKLNKKIPVKRPLWHSIGGILALVPIVLIIGLFLFSLIYHTINPSAAKKLTKHEDVRKEWIDKDFKQLDTSITYQTDSISTYLSNCMSYTIESDVDMDKIRYYSKSNNNKVLVLLKIRDIKKIKAGYRKEFIKAVEICLDEYTKATFDEYFIGVQGKYNTVLVKTPTDADLKGRFADKYKLITFYNDEEVDQIPMLDTIQ